ncbi:MAG: SsrA-binding protein SmpB [Gammaproteobacteria bacterium]
MSDKTIIYNKKAKHEYSIEETFEAGLVLEGWELKSLRAGRVQIIDSYVLIKKGEAFVLGLLVNPLYSASTHRIADPTRTRKLLLHKKEITTLIGLRERKGYTIVPLNLHWKKNKIKILIGVAKGKKAHDKRAADQDKTWQRDKQRLLKTQNSKK